jgi:hypothetical protein
VIKLTTPFVFLFLYLFPMGLVHRVMPRFIPVENPGQMKDIQPAIEMALREALDGDVLLLPEGKFEFKKTIKITRNISIRGWGPKTTILFRSEAVPDSLLSSPGWESFFDFIPSSTSTYTIHVSDLALESKKPSRENEDLYSRSPDFGIRLINCVDFVITRCCFRNFGKAAISVQHEDTLAGGVISGNEFHDNRKGSDGLGLGYGVLVYGKNKQWLKQVRFGSANFIFIESNTFYHQRHAVAAGGCGLYVFRYNTVTENIIGPKSGQAVDAHEGRGILGDNYYSTRAVEVYENILVNTSFKDGTPIVPGKSPKNLVENAILLRGGEALVHDNSIAGYRFGIGIINFQLKPPQPYPIISQIGYLSGLQFGEEHSGTDSLTGNGDLFMWNNRFTRYVGRDTSSEFYNYQPCFFKEDRDYHFVPKPGYRTYPYPHPLLLE